MDLGLLGQDVGSGGAERHMTLHGNVHQVDHVPNGPTNSAAITTMLPLRICGGKLLVAVTRERRYGPSRDYALTTTTMAWR